MNKRFFRSLASAFVLLSALAAASQADWFGRLFDGRKNSGKAPETQAVPSAAGAAVNMDDRVWVVLHVPDDKTARSMVADAGISIEEIHGDTVGGTATLEAVGRLQDKKSRNKGISVLKRIPLRSFSNNKNFPAPDDQYRSYGDVNSVLSSLAQAHPDIISLIQIGNSVEGKDIKGVRFNTSAKNTEPSEKPGILFLGTHHAREHLSTEVPLLLAKWLAENRNNPEVKRLLETRDIYIVPLVNPDGSEFDRGRKWQRKNMRDPSGARGIDLNRNYGFHWGEGGASPDPSDETYRGPSAFSEPETQGVKQFVESHPNLKVLLSYHTFSELILYPWGHTYEPIDDGQALKAYKAMAQQMAGWTGYTPEQSSGLYIASGDTTDWAWGVHKIFSFTFELTPKGVWEGGFYPGNDAIEPTFQKNIKPALYLIDLADNPYRADPSMASKKRLAPLAASTNPLMRAPAHSPATH